MKKIIYHNKIIAEIHPYLDLKECKNEKTTPQNFVECLTQTIPGNSTGYAGFQTRNYLCESLLFHIFGLQSGFTKTTIGPTKHFTKEISYSIEKAMKEAYKYLPSRARTRVYVFPTSRSFVQRRMFGVNGMTPYRNTFHVYIHPSPQNQEACLREINHTVAHEYNHTVRFQCFQPSFSSTLLEGFVNEGLAENFRMDVLGGTVSPWAGSLQYDDAKKAFTRIRPLLHSTGKKAYKAYYDIFFADKKYPLWTGYAIGYQIVKSFLQKLPAVRWTEIIKLPSQEILKRSGF